MKNDGHKITSTFISMVPGMIALPGLLVLGSRFYLAGDVLILDAIVFYYNEKFKILGRQIRLFALSFWLTLFLSTSFAFISLVYSFSNEIQALIVFFGLAYFIFLLLRCKT